MTQPDFNSLVDSVIASMGGSPTSAEVEAAALRILDGSSDSSSSDSSSGELKALEAIQISVSLTSCTSRRAPTQHARGYDKIRRADDRIKLVLPDVARAYSIPVPPVELVLRDTTTLMAGHPNLEWLALSATIQQAAVDASIAVVKAPFLDLSLPESFQILDLIPELLDLGAPLQPTIQIGTDGALPPLEILHALATGMGIHNRSKSSKDASASIVVNGCERRAYGHRVHTECEAVSVVLSDSDQLRHAEDFGQSLTRVLGPQSRLLHLEVRLSSAENIPRQVVHPVLNSSVTVSTLLDGLPVLGSAQNRLSIPKDFAPDQMVNLLNDRLAVPAGAGKLAGIVIDFRPW